MMCNKRGYGMVFGLLAGFFWSAPARADDSIRCKKRIVSVGETALELRKLCGAPNHIASYPVLLGTGIVGIDGTRALQYTQEEIETWTYMGDSNEFMRLVRIRRGKITEIKSVSKLTDKAEQDCSLAILRDRATTGEVFVMCGAPLDQSRWVEEQLVRNRAGVEVRRLLTRERWVYDPGPGRFLRIIDFENGRLISIETGRRSRD